MNPALDKLARDKRLMAFTAAAMYGGAALDAALEGLLPGDPPFAIVPALAAAVVVGLLVLFGPRLPRAALGLLGPLGVALIAAALSSVPGAGDGAVLYIWPVLWSTFFFGRRGAIAILTTVAIAHALTLLTLPAASAYPGRWIDVMVVTSVVAAVILTLVARNDELLERLAGEARADALTGLINRRGFDERAAQELARAQRDSSSLAIVSFDIDYFKRINDEWGHETGDRVLARTGTVLAAHSREIDLVARFGGEEFVVLLPDSDNAAAVGYAERVRFALADDDGSGLPRVRASAGVATAVAPSGIEPLLAAADSALYRAKRGGRDRTTVYEPMPVSEVPVTDPLAHEALTPRATRAHAG